LTMPEADETPHQLPLPEASCLSSAYLLSALSCHHAHQSSPQAHDVLLSDLDSAVECTRRPAPSCLRVKSCRQPESGRRASTRTTTTSKTIKHDYVLYSSITHTQQFNYAMKYIARIIFTNGHECIGRILPLPKSASWRDHSHRGCLYESRESEVKYSLKRWYTLQPHLPASAWATHSETHHAQSTSRHIKTNGRPHATFSHDAPSLRGKRRESGR
jgi:hypothetical protein